MTDKIHNELVEWADKFLKAAIWKNISDSDNFCIQHESWKEPAFISIMGNAGLTYGISVWRGVKSYKLLEGLRNSDIDMDTAFIEGDVMCVDKSRTLKNIWPGWALRCYALRECRSLRK